VASESTAKTDPTTTEFLQELVLDSADVESFLDGLAGVSARHLSGDGDVVLAGVTLLRNKKAATVASSSEEALAMDEIQYAYGDGPCMTASREQVTVHVPDLRNEQRWPDYAEAVKDQGMRSVLAVPIALEGDSRAALNLYSNRPGRFDEATVQFVEEFARQASMALRMAVRFAQLTDTSDNLKAALQSRTTIDIAIGVIMAQNRCSQETAFDILRTASNTRNIKLRDVAAAVVVSLGQGHAETHYEH
jgi:GAF domain-containing protein